MFFRQFLSALALLLLGSGPAFGFYDPPVIDPPRSVAGQLIGIYVRAGICDLVQAPLIAGDEWRELVVEGHTLKVTVRGIDGNFNDDFCIYPIGTWRFSLGRYEAGNYRLELYRRNVIDLSDVRFVASTNFVVGASPAAVPAIDRIGQFMLGLTLMALGLAALQAQRIRT